MFSSPHFVLVFDFHSLHFFLCQLRVRVHHRHVIVFVVFVRQLHPHILGDSNRGSAFILKVITARYLLLLAADATPLDMSQ